MKLVLLAAVICIAIIQPCLTHTALLHDNNNVNPSTALDIKGSQSLARYDSRFAISDIWTSIKEKIEEAWETIKAVGANLIDKTKQWLDNIITKSKQLIEDAKKELEIYKAKVEDFIKMLQEKAYEIGLNIKECTEENKESLIKLLTDTLSTIMECLFTKVIAGQKVLESTTEFVELELNLDDVVNNGLERCGNAADIDSCLANFIEEFNGTTMKKSDTFEALEIENRGILETLGEALQSCVSENLKTIGSQILNETKVIIECVNKKTIERYLS